MTTEAPTSTQTEIEQARAVAQLQAVVAQLREHDRLALHATTRRDALIRAAVAKGGLSHARVAALASIHKSNVGQRLPIPGEDVEHDEQALIKAGAEAKSYDEARSALVALRDRMMAEYHATYAGRQERLVEITGLSAQTVSNVLAAARAAAAV